MEISDYIFIGYVVIAFFGLLVILLNKIIPKENMMKSSQSSIKKGENIGAIIGIMVCLYICYHLTINNYFRLYDVFFE